MGSDTAAGASGPLVITDEHMLAFRTAFVEDYQEARAGALKLAELGREGGWHALEPLSYLLFCAMDELLRHKVGPQPTGSDIIRLVAELRGRLPREDFFKLEPMLAEMILRWMIGDPVGVALIGDIPERTNAEMQMYLLQAFRADTELTGPRLDTFLAAVRARAQEWIDAGTARPAPLTEPDHQANQE